MALPLLQCVTLDRPLHPSAPKPGAVKKRWYKTGTAGKESPGKAPGAQEASSEVGLLTAATKWWGGGGKGISEKARPWGPRLATRWTERARPVLSSQGAQV